MNQNGSEENGSEENDSEENDSEEVEVDVEVGEKEVDDSDVDDDFDDDFDDEILDEQEHDVIKILNPGRAVRLERECARKNLDVNQMLALRDSPYSKQRDLFNAFFPLYSNWNDEVKDIYIRRTTLKTEKGGVVFVYSDIY